MVEKNYLYIGAVLLPLALANNVGYISDLEINPDQWLRHSPDHHHSPEDSPAWGGTRTDSSTATGSGSTVITPGTGALTLAGSIVSTGTMYGGGSWD